MGAGSSGEGQERHIESLVWRQLNPARTIKPILQITITKSKLSPEKSAIESSAGLSNPSCSRIPWGACQTQIQVSPQVFRIQSVLGGAENFPSLQIGDADTASEDQTLRITGLEGRNTVSESSRAKPQAQPTTDLLCEPGEVSNLLCAFLSTKRPRIAPGLLQLL